MEFIQFFSILKWPLHSFRLHHRIRFTSHSRYYRINYRIIWRNRQADRQTTHPVTHNNIIVFHQSKFAKAHNERIRIVWIVAHIALKFIWIATTYILCLRIFLLCTAMWDRCWSLLSICVLLTLICTYPFLAFFLREFS